jgi:hypothetical protein
MKFKVSYQTVIQGANKADFFEGTKANFTSCEMPEGKPDYTSNSGSIYFYTKDGVIRVANHWLGVASCKWILDGQDEYAINKATDKREFAVAGFCKWSEFSRIGFVEEIKEMPKGTRKNSYKVVDGIGYKTMEKVA